MKKIDFVSGHLEKWPSSCIFDWPIGENGCNDYGDVPCQLWCLFHNLHDSPQKCMSSAPLIVKEADTLSNYNNYYMHQCIRYLNYTIIMF